MHTRLIFESCFEGGEPLSSRGGTGQRPRLEDLLIVEDHLRCRFSYFELVADFLDLRCLLFQACREGLNFLLLLRNGVLYLTGG